MAEKNTASGAHSAIGADRARVEADPFLRILHHAARNRDGEGIPRGKPDIRFVGSGFADLSHSLNPQGKVDVSGTRSNPARGQTDEPQRGRFGRDEGKRAGARNLLLGHSARIRTSVAPTVFLSPPLVDDMLIRLIHVTDPGGSGAGAGAGRAGVGAPESVKALVTVMVPAGLEPELARDWEPGHPETPSFCCGIRTMNASFRLVPRLVPDEILAGGVQVARAASVVVTATA